LDDLIGSTMLIPLTIAFDGYVYLCEISQFCCLREANDEVEGNGDLYVTLF